MKTGTAFRRVAAMLAVTLPALAAPASVETHTVTLAGFDFDPADLTIELGDTVSWEWVSGVHNVESGVGGTHDGNFSSGPAVNSPGLTYEVTFDQAFLDGNPMPDDEYPYYCAVHVSFGMTGIVRVLTPCPADIDGCGVVDVDDLVAVIVAWGTSDPAADINDDHVVNVDDLVAVILAWGPC